MNLSTLLRARADAGRPVRVGLIGAGKFGSMFLSQGVRTPGLHITGIADLDVARARQSAARVGWSEERYGARSLDEAVRHGSTCITEDSAALIASEVEVIVDATGSPAAGIHHALLCCEHRKHIIMVNVEADALAGPLLARKAAEAGIVYSFAYGDQPALIAEMVDWARTAGLDVVCAGKGTKIPASLSRVDARYGVDPLRLLAGTGRQRRLQCPDVQLIFGRGRNRPWKWPPSQMPPAWCRRATGCHSRPAARMTCRPC